MGKRNGLIDFYRFIFSLVIVFHHAMWLDGGGDINTQYPDGWCRSLEDGVSKKHEGSWITNWYEWLDIKYNRNSSW